MKKFLSSLLLALTVIVAASPVYADGESISSVTVVGATEQSGTPTPTNPVNIVTNNGVVKLNNFRGNIPSVLQKGVSSIASIDSLALDPNKTYTLSCFVSADFSSDSNFIFSLREGGVGRANITGAALTAKAGTFYTRTFSGMDLVRFANSMDIQSGQLSMFQITDNTVYTEGAGETIADSANHTATVETLFAVGDYADEQNINTGVITRKVGVKVLDGTENWTTYNVPGVGYSYRTYITDASTIKDDYKPVLSSHFEYTKWSWLQNKNSISFDNLENNLLYVRCLPFGQSSNVTGFKQWLAEQYANGTPVIIVYPLATETTENVTAQTMTTAPVIQNNGTIATTIRTLLQNGQTLLSNSLKLGIKIATTAYNNSAFSSVQTALNTAVSTIKDVVANTITQTAAIAQIASDKQTRPNSACPAGKTCLLVEDMNGEPHWYEIIENIYGLPSGYTALEYIESTGTQYIDTGVIVQTPQTLTGTTIDFMVTSVDTAVGNSACVAGAIIAGSGAGAYKNTQIIVYQNQLNDGLGFTFSQSDWHQRIVATCNGAGPASPNMSFLLFGRNRTNNMGPQLLGGVRIYSAKIYENGTLVRDFIPVKYVSGNTTTYGMYDTVSGTFYTNAGSGTFTAGPAVQ